MSLTSTQLPLLHGAEQRRVAVLRGKRRAFVISCILLLTATLPSIIVSLTGEPNFPGRWVYWLTNGAVLAAAVWCLLALRDLENVRLVERVGLTGSLIYLFAWDIVPLAAHYVPKAEFLMTNVPAFVLALVLLCLVVERKRLTLALVVVFVTHELLTWAGLLQHPWGSVHNAQLTTDLMVVVATVFLYLIGSFQHLISTSRQETEVVRLLVNTDELTGLANARSIAAQLSAIPRCAVLLIEIDDFEGWLVDLGEERQDEVFFQLARTLRREVGKHGSCGRWGNNQFVVLLPYAEKLAALKMAQVLRENLMALDFGEPFTLSMGVAVPRTDLDGIEVLHLAAQRLAEAQTAGGDRIEGRAAKTPET